MTLRRPLRVLIVDDESLARQRLEDLLRKEPDVEIAGFATDGNEAVAAIREMRPDLVFLDVQMPGRSGLEVIQEIGPREMPAVVFVTAYDQYALQAFDLAAIDYLMKPFDDERFEQAFRRARRGVELEEVGRLSEELFARLQAIRAASDGGSPLNVPPRTGYLERIAVELRGQVRVVPVEQIDYVTASGPYAELHVAGKTYLIRERMQSLEARLDPSQFFRVHRSAIVRLDRIESLLHDPGGDYAVRLRNGAQISVSRSRVEQLEKWMGR